MRHRFVLVTCFAANLGLVLYGLAALIWPGILLEPFLKEVYRFPDSAAAALAYLAALFRLLGSFNLTLGIVGLMLLRRWMISREPWILPIVSLSTTLAYIGPIVFDNTVGSIGPFEIAEHVLFALIVVAGIVSFKHPGAV